MITEDPALRNSFANPNPIPELPPTRIALFSYTTGTTKALLNTNTPVIKTVASLQFSGCLYGVSTSDIV